MRCSTSFLSRGSGPKKCSRMYAPPATENFWNSPSSVSFICWTRRPSTSRARRSSHSRPQITLMTFQPAPRNADSSSWMILPLPRTGPSSRCRLQLTTKVRLSRPSRDATWSAPSDSGSSVSPSPRKAHTRESDVSSETAVLEIAVVARLVDRADRPEAHRHRRELPELGHEPRVRVRAEALAGHRLAAEVIELVDRQSPFEEGAGVDAGRRMALVEDLVAARAAVLAAEEVVEADLVQRRRRGIRREVAADPGELGVRPEDHRDRVPADEPADAPLHLLVARERRFLFGADRVDVAGLGQRREADLQLAGALEQLVDDEPGAGLTLVGDDLVERGDPVVGFGGIDVGQLVLELVEVHHGQRSPSRPIPAVAGRSRPGFRCNAAATTITKRGSLPRRATSACSR